MKYFIFIFPVLASISTFAHPNETLCMSVWEKQNNAHIVDFKKKYQDSVREKLKSAYLSSGFIITDADIKFDITFEKAELVKNEYNNYQYKNPITMSDIEVSQNGKTTVFNLSPTVSNATGVTGYLFLRTEFNWNEQMNAIGDVSELNCYSWSRSGIEINGIQRYIDNFTLFRSSNGYIVSEIPGNFDKYLYDLIKF